LAGNTIYTLPTAFPAGTYLLNSTSAGVMGFTDPSTFLTGLTVGTTTITSGTTTRILYDNAGVLGEYTITGSGNVVMSTSPTLVTPSFTTGFKIGGAAASRKMLVGNGTNYVASTETWAVPGTSGNVLQSDGTNWTSVTPTIVLSGTFTPSPTNDVNLDAFTAYECQYLRVGDVVNVSGKISLDASSSATTTSIELDLPFVSTFTNDREAAGTGWSSEITGAGFQISSVGSLTTVKISFISLDAATHEYSYHYTYRIIN
jgi:hypothetical protein